MTGILAAIPGLIKPAGGGPDITVPTSAFTDDSDTLLLLHFDGANNSTTTTDDNSSGRTAKTITMANGAKLYTGTKKFGNASCEYDGSGGDVVYTPDSNDWDIGNTSSGLYKTFECWVYIGNLSAWSRNSPNHLPKMMGHMGQAGNIYWCFGPNEEGGVSFYYWSGGNNWTHSTIKDLTTSTWYHIAGVLNNGVFKIYVDGFEWLSKTISNNPVAGNTDFAIGAEFGACVDGYIDEVRVSNVNRYT